MLILHENLEQEARVVAKALKKTYGFNSDFFNEVGLEMFTRLPNFSGDSYLVNGFIMNQLMNTLKDNAFMILTAKDIYGNVQSQKDDWVLGGSYGSGSICSVSRLRGLNGEPSRDIGVNTRKYNRRLETLAIHEVGHDVIGKTKAPHLKPAFWVNAESGYKMGLGPHCDDNRCVMYEVVDVKTTPAEEGWLLLGDEKLFDAGLDECMKRQYKDLFCGRCKSAINVGRKYTDRVE